jgi:hypothetical protein
MEKDLARKSHFCKRSRETKNSNSLLNRGLEPTLLIILTLTSHD